MAIDVQLIMMVNSAQPGEGGGRHALPLSLYLPSIAKLWCTPQLRGQIHSSYFSSTLFSSVNITNSVFNILAAPNLCVLYVSL
jgi:hypothetical protein